MLTTCKSFKPPFNEERTMSRDPEKSERAIELPTLEAKHFADLMRSVILNPNLGAGIDASGVSGSGKSNFSQWAAMESLSLGVPFLLLDPHGDSARKVLRMAMQQPRRIRERVLFWKVADPNNVAAINPLAHDDSEDELTDYERRSRGRIQIELTADIILAAVGEAGTGFGGRPVLRKWITRWLSMLWSAGLTLADARMLIDPHHPLYEKLVQLAPDDMARHQMLALPGMRVSDLENEIGSARNRFGTVLEHPAAEMLLSRRHNTINFRSLYHSGTSLIVDLSKGEILTDEVQRLICNIVLNQYLAVVVSTPEHKRQRRLCIIDELPVFSDASGPLLERMCTEIRKYLTSFLFLHQGSSRFPGRTDNEFFQTINDMCRVKVLFRHNTDAEWFGRQIALAAHTGPKVKHVQRTPQQTTIGHQIVELIDHGSGTSEMTGATITEGETNSLTDTLGEAVRVVDGDNDITSNRSNASGTSRSSAKAQQRTSTTTNNRTVKQTLLPILETRNIVSSVQFYSSEEAAWDGASTIKNLDTGEAVVVVDGTGVWVARTPLAAEPFDHAPEFAARKLNEWRQQMLEQPMFAAPTLVLEERKEFVRKLTAELTRLTYQSGGLEQHRTTLNIGDVGATGDPDSEVAL